MSPSSRAAHLAAMREHGLAIESTDAAQCMHLPQGAGDRRSEDHRAGRPGHVRRQALGHRRCGAPAPADHGPETGIISFQNGVQKDDMLRPIFGDKALMGGVAYVGTTINRPGVIAQTGPLQRLVFGEYDGRRSPRAEGSWKPASAAASTPSSATMSGARSGRNSWCWSRCRVRPPPCARRSDRSARTRSRANSCSTLRARWSRLGAALERQSAGRTMPSSASRSSTTGRPR